MLKCVPVNMRPFNVAARSMVSGEMSFLMRNIKKSISHFILCKTWKGEKPKKYLGRFLCFAAARVLLCNDVRLVGWQVELNLIWMLKSFRMENSVAKLFPSERLPFEIENHSMRPFSIPNSSNHHRVCGMCSNKPNKRYFRWFYCCSLDFWCCFCVGKVWEWETCNENRCDLYHHIVNLIYNNAGPAHGVFFFSAQRTSWVYWITSSDEVSSRDLSRIVMSALKPHFSSGREEKFYDSIFH